MYHEKQILSGGSTFVAYQSTWLVPETVRFHELTICERAVLRAPAGKFLTLTVNGVGKELAPGTYKGDVVLSVTEAYDMAPGGLMRFNEIGRNMHTAIVVRDGKVVREECVPAIIHGGSVADAVTEGVYIASEEECFNGIIVAGDGSYTVRGAKMDLEGFSDNDFLGVGCAVTAVDQAKVTIEDCDFTLSGVTRCAIHVGGQSEVTVKNTKVINLSPASDWTGSFSWQVGFCGTNRLAQLTDDAKVIYDNCDLKTNGWGLLSIDGSNNPVSMMVKNSRLELSGPRAHGYGAFCIGDNEITFDNCDVNVTGYPMLLMGMERVARANILNSRIKGRRFGTMVVSDDHSVLTIKNTSFQTDKSTLCVKGSDTVINMDGVSAVPGNGTILQLMDSDTGNMTTAHFYVPVGVVDEAIPGRDLTAVTEEEGIRLNISNSRLAGNFFNSTSNIRALSKSAHEGRGKFHDTVIGIMKMDLPEGDPDHKPNGGDEKGPRNLELNLVSTQIEGIISSALQAYPDGVTVIYEDNRMELSNVTQTAAPTVNNGVIVNLDKDSQWIVTGTSYITALTLADGASVNPPQGKIITVTVDGQEVSLKPGSYSGKIVLSVE